MPLRGETGVRFVDSHVHLSDYLEPRQPLQFAASAGVILVSAGIDASSSARATTLSRNRPELVKAFVGVHPSEAQKEPAPIWVEKALARAWGVGEIGLDPKYSEVSPGSTQWELFRCQLALAEKAEKPVQVHSRGAERECLDVLATFRMKGVLLHWFQGEKLLSEASGKGFYVSFGPALLVSKKLQRMAAAWDREHVLVESDGPVRFAALGEAGGPWLVPSVVFRLTQILGSSFEETADAIRDNSLAYLGEKG